MISIIVSVEVAASAVEAGEADIIIIHSGGTLGLRAPGAMATVRFLNGDDTILI